MDPATIISGSLFTRDYLGEAIAESHEWRAIDADALRADLAAIFSRFPHGAGPNESQTERDLIWPVLTRLGWTAHLEQQNLSATGREDVPDGLLFLNEETKARANADPREWQRYAHGTAIVEAKRWDRPLDRRLGRDAESAPSTQMKSRKGDRPEVDDGVDRVLRRELLPERGQHLGRKFGPATETQQPGPEHQLRDRLSFMRFAGLALSDAVPDAKTIWLYREQLVRAGAFERLFARFDVALAERGYLAMGGQIVDATIVEARRPRLTQAEKDVMKGGGVPEHWKPARARQIDREGRWTLKRGRKKPIPPAGSARTAAPEIAMPMFGYKNHVGIDREHGFVRRFTVTHAAAHDGAQLGAVLDPGNTASVVWADTAYRSADNLALLARRGLKPAFQRPKPRGKPMPRQIARGNARRARIRSRVEHVFAAQKRRFDLVIRTVGKAGARRR